MSKTPTQEQLAKTLLEAGKAHHEFQTNFLNGVRHTQCMEENTEPDSSTCQLLSDS
jgi:hypothetical protein